MPRTKLTRNKITRISRAFGRVGPPGRFAVFRRSALAVAKTYKMSDLSPTSPDSLGTLFASGGATPVGAGW